MLDVLLLIVILLVLLIVVPDCWHARRELAKREGCGHRKGLERRSRPSL